MTIQSIYQKYFIPLNLQQHMLRVGALGSIICDNFQDISINKDLIVKTLLLHDMGNILKFDFTKLDLLVEEDKARVTQLKKIQQEFISKYGSDPDEATLAIIKEMAIDSAILALCKNSHWELVEQFLDKDFWDRKICSYADMRIGPFGLMKLIARFDDLMKRRLDQQAALEILLQQGIALERQLQGVLKIDLQQITEEMIEQEIEKIKFLEFYQER